MSQVLMKKAILKQVEQSISVFDFVLLKSPLTYLVIAGKRDPFSTLPK